MKSPKIIFIPNFTMIFSFSKCQNLRCFQLVFYRVVNEKVRIIKNFEEAKFGQF